MSSTAASADAKLIALCDRGIAMDAACTALAEPYWESDIPEPPEVYRQQVEMVQATHRLAERAALTPAATRAGMAAKARLMLTYRGADAAGRFRWRNHDDLLAWSIARDLLGADEVPKAPDLGSEEEGDEVRPRPRSEAPA